MLLGKQPSLDWRPGGCLSLGKFWFIIMLIECSRVVAFFSTLKSFHRYFTPHPFQSSCCFLFSPWWEGFLWSHFSHTSHTHTQPSSQSGQWFSPPRSTGCWGDEDDAAKSDIYFPLPPPHVSKNFGRRETMEKLQSKMMMILQSKRQRKQCLPLRREGWVDLHSIAVAGEGKGRGRFMLIK